MTIGLVAGVTSRAIKKSNMKNMTSNGAGGMRAIDTVSHAPERLNAAISGSHISRWRGLVNATSAHTQVTPGSCGASALLIERENSANAVYQQPLQKHAVSMILSSEGVGLHAQHGEGFEIDTQNGLLFLPTSPAFYLSRNKSIALFILLISPFIFDQIKLRSRALSRKNVVVRLPQTMAFQDQILADLIGVLSKALMAKKCSALFLELLTQAISEHLLEQHGDVPSDREPRRLTSDPLQSLDNYLSRRLSQGVSAQEAAAFLKMELPKFQRFLRARTGYGFVRYLLQFRLREAHAMLSKKQLTVTQVAAETGFFDAAHLCKAFRKAFGVSPSQLAS